MRITIGIKVLIGCTIASAIAMTILSLFQNFLQGYLIFGVISAFMGAILFGLFWGILLQKRASIVLEMFPQTSQLFINTDLNLSGNDEFAQIAVKIKKFQSDFEVRIRDTSLITNTLSRIANETLLETIQALSDSKSQADKLRTLSVQTTESHTKSEELGRRLSEVSDFVNNTFQEVTVLNSFLTEENLKVDSAADISQKAVEAAREGTGFIREMQENMRQTAEDVKQAATTISKLGKSSDEIEEIISVIDDIADQTNLLALNAAIEAARAGEQGRGFAVVAESVRNLAEKTQKATKEIIGMIKYLQAETKGAVISIKVGNQQVEMGVDMSSKAGDALKKIVTSAEKVNQFTCQIKKQISQQEQNRQKFYQTTNDLKRSSQTILDMMADQHENYRSIRKNVEYLDKKMLNNTQTLSNIQRDVENLIPEIARLTNFCDQFYFPSQKELPESDQDQTQAEEKVAKDN